MRTVNGMETSMAIGTEDFAEVRSNYYFVDKTGFISECFSHHARHAKVTLLARPRRFGKTMLMSMMHRFLDIRGADENRKLFDGLKVTKDARVMAEQGTRPVVFLTLRDWEAGKWEEMQKFIAFGLQDACRSLHYLLESDAVTEKDKRDFQMLEERKGNLSLMRRALVLFCKMLENHYGKKAVLLIDEYDAPIQCAWSHGYYKEAIEFYRGFFAAALKSNPSLDFAILTGVLRIAKESIFSGLNNLEVSTVVSGGYPDACGYTREEVAKMARDLGREDKLAELASWYDGYAFQGVDIYNPWSVNNYFKQDCKARAYWVNTSGNSILRTMLEDVTAVRERELAGLMEGKTIPVQLDEAFIYQNIGQKKDDLYTLMLFTGYLKCVGIESDEDDDETYELSIPNREIRSVFRREILDNLSGHVGRSILRDMMQAMLEGDTDIFESCLRQILRGMVSFYDVAHPESFYHGMMLGMTVWLDKKFTIQSNRESGYGRFDLALFPKTKDLPGVLMEFKSAKSEEDLQREAEKAQQQMLERGYSASMKDAGVERIWCYGIAFFGKQVFVTMVS